MSKKIINVAIAGVGTVGTPVFEYVNSGLLENPETKACVTKISSRKERKFENVEWESDPLKLIDKNVDVIIELIGGEDGIAYKLVKKALTAKKHVITANKALLSRHGNELFDLAKKNNVELLFEAAIAGAVPVVKAIKTSLRCNKITEIFGILNGTCNYILTNMERDDVSFERALELAQNNGYAESDPTFDIDGIDAYHKITLLSALAYKTKISEIPSYIRGIRNLHNSSFEIAEELGYAIRLLARSVINEENQVYHYVCPYFVSKAHPLANIDETLNSVYIESDLADEMVLTGHGAGGKQTASSVIADLNDIISGNRFLIENHEEVKYLKDFTEKRNLLIHFERDDHFMKAKKIIGSHVSQSFELLGHHVIKFTSESVLGLDKMLNDLEYLGVFEVC
jgi:homoserine dehydrogenase